MFVRLQNVQRRVPVNSARLKRQAQCIMRILNLNDFRLDVWCALFRCFASLSPSLSNYAVLHRLFRCFDSSECIHLRVI